MIISPIVLKGNEKGIRLIIAHDASNSQINAELEKKLHMTKQCYQTKRPIHITFEGKCLTNDEKQSIINILQNAGLNIKIHNTLHPKEDKYEIKRSDTDGLFYVGNLRNGQVLETKESIVIVGNVEQGAAVYSEGNIIITGELKGYAQAGCKGRKETFVYSYLSGRKHS